MGEADMRSIYLFGDGMYKSVNGKTWSKSGLDKADAIANIEVHPLMLTLFCCCNGNPFKSNPERGVYRSKTVEIHAISSF
jgi:hypothetical protein